MAGAELAGLRSPAMAFPEDTIMTKDKKLFAAPTGAV